MLLAGGIDAAATPAGGSAGWTLGHRGDGSDGCSGASQMPEQIGCGIAHRGDLRGQRLPIQPALGFRVYGADHRSELFGERHDALMQTVIR